LGVPLDEAAIRADEREACARIAEDEDHRVEGRGYYDQLGDANATQHNIVKAIRARGVALGVEPDWKALYADAMTASNEAGCVGMTPAETIRFLAHCEPDCLRSTLSAPMPQKLADQIAAALECGVLWARSSEGHPRMQRALDDFNEWRTAGVTEGANDQGEKA
jgi:hypothetical protein